MARPEPFRAMLEQAFAAEGKNPPPSLLSPIPEVPFGYNGYDPRSLERRLDQLLLAGGVTPPRGMHVPTLRRDVPLRLDPTSRSVPAASPPASARALEVTAELGRPAVVDAALQDSLAATEMTEVNREQRAVPIASYRGDDVSLPPVDAAATDAAGTGQEDTRKIRRSRPPAAPPVAPASSAPPPTLRNEDTSPGTPFPTSASGSPSASGRVPPARSDLYRLQLELEDTPARPLPAHASLQPLPLLPPSLSQALERARGISTEAPALVEPDGGDDEAFAPRSLRIEPADLQRLDELEGIEDLDSLARALGLKSVADVSLPSSLRSEEGPVWADDEPSPGLTSDSHERTGELPIRQLLPSEVTAIRRAAVLAALADDKETVFASGEGRSMAATRPPLPALGVAVPVIVRIPSRPKVTLAAREKARKLYLSALEELGRGNKLAAVGHLKLAVQSDDGVQLYRDLLAQIEKSSKVDEPIDAAGTDPGEAPALMVMKTSGQMISAREERRR